ncbi:MAG: hypothetical protein KF863_00890 [Rubrivivax sp.]|nr:hypothetical protein [Rubrivivax sp.]
MTHDPRRRRAALPARPAALAVLLLAAWLLAWAGVARAQMADPRVPWSSADSAHFRVHYRDGQRAQAEAVARAAERAWGRVTEALQWQPRGRTEIVLYSETDLANGFATPLPANRVGIHLAPPDDGELLDNSAWLDLLLVHELTHTVHLDKVRGAPLVLQAIFGRVFWFMPNLFQPAWMLEGLAVLHESDPASGRGRLRGPWFEAWLRAERTRGFVSLAEINADGRRLPVAQQYLYGAYFFDFLQRRHGAAAAGAIVERYSGNLVPRLHSAPWAATGRTMDALWAEFLQDLARQVDERAAALRVQPQVVGEALPGGPWFAAASLAALPAQAGGGWLAVLDDGVHAAQLVRIAPDGSRRALTRVQRGARLDVAADGRVLVAQPERCDTHYLSYDLFRLEGTRLRALTDCAHLRRAVQAGGQLFALQLDAGRTRLVRLDGAGGVSAVLLAPADGSELVDLAALDDGAVAVVTRRPHDAGADWRVLRVDPAQPQAASVLLARGTPITGLRRGATGLEMILVEEGVPNVWRLAGGPGAPRLQRLTHSHTAVVAHAGTAADGALLSAVIAPSGYALHRLAAAQPLQEIAVDAGPPSPPAAAAADPAPAATTAVLGDGAPYAGWRSMAPHSWLPAALSDRGLTALGASTFGEDALGWHRWTATALWETSQREPLGSVEYLWRGAHGVALTRTLSARAWTGDRGDETTTVYDRRTQAQWLSLLPVVPRLERRVLLGLGAALDRIERIDVAATRSARPRDERLLAVLADFDTGGGNWASEGRNRGLRATLLVESYEPFAGDARAYDGQVTRADLRGWLPLGRSVLALRWTEARASGRTEPFQLGGASDEWLQIGFVLNQRDIALRGYRGDEPVLRGRHGRVASAEWRFTLADIDRHGMVPPLGINRLSGAVFVDAGGAWDAGSRPDRWRRGAGFELLAETRLLYAMALQLRLGYARALDAPEGGRGYLTMGRAF